MKNNVHNFFSFDCDFFLSEKEKFVIDYEGAAAKIFWKIKSAH